MQRLGVGGNYLDPEAICLAKERGALPLASTSRSVHIPLDFKDYLNRYKAVKLRLTFKTATCHSSPSLDAQHRFTQPG